MRTATRKYDHPRRRLPQASERVQHATLPEPEHFARARGGRVRGGGEVRARTHGFRPVHRRVPGPALQARGDVPRHRSRARDALPRLRHRRSVPRSVRGGDRQDLLQRDVAPRYERGDPGTRRLRLHRRVSGVTLLPRGALWLAWRRYERDTEGVGGQEDPERFRARWLPRHGHVLIPQAPCATGLKTAQKRALGRARPAAAWCGMKKASVRLISGKAAGIRNSTRFDQRHDATPFRRRVGFPVRNFPERAEAANAKPRNLVDAAFANTRRLDRGFFRHAAALAAMAFAARELVGLPSSPQMYSPAAMSLRMSTPVSMPSPSSR